MLPPSAVIRLNDRFGDYVIHVRCRKCRHSRDIDPHALAKLVGWEARIDELSLRFRCSKCHSKQAEVEIGFTRKPRRWNKNPS